MVLVVNFFCGCEHNSLNFYRKRNYYNCMYFVICVESVLIDCLKVCTLGWYCLFSCYTRPLTGRDCLTTLLRHLGCILYCTMKIK